jgi:hypothetical protein
LHSNDLADLQASANPWLQFSGPGAADFSLTNATTIDANTVQFTIQFAPTAAGIWKSTATLYLSAMNAPYTFLVKGTGV